MPEILFGALVIVGTLFLRQVVTGADLTGYVNRFRRLGIGGLLIAAIFAVALDRVGLGVLLAGLSWGVFTGGRAVPPRWAKSWRAVRGQRQARYMRTRCLDVEIDVGTGRISGQVLDAMDLVAVLRFRRGINGQSLQLLDAYLDQRFGSVWRDHEMARQGHDAAVMSRLEAYAILGLESGASPEEIRSAHRRSMLHNHPDRGGSHAQAIRLNQARDVLLA